MEGRQILGLALIFCITVITPVYCQYYSETLPFKPMEEQVSYLRFFFHHTLSGKNPTAVLIARPNITNGGEPRTPFGYLYAVDDILTTGREPTSEVIGNAQGMYVSSGKDDLSLVVYLDFAITKGQFNGSSFSVFSRNPVLDIERELAVVGGRGQFRLARGFCHLKTISVNGTSGNAILLSTM
ncbi:dirigent protein 4 [Ricinus communis]|uniref:Dirigent protein n=1 Tax=Ricinus communis TaxID=3988 RepID=B9SQK7_RICCO|nr:dirigent protein 4 [Ricinus communis]EEF34114.1 Disease resistance response protein, putative [Ricinus communis]|eukprot:XP_002528276.1 dirigent protein 4 [Ricinus communis]